MTRSGAIEAGLLHRFVGSMFKGIYLGNIPIPTGPDNHRSRSLLVGSRLSPNGGVTDK